MSKRLNGALVVMLLAFAPAGMAATLHLPFDLNLQDALPSGNGVPGAGRIDIVPILPGPVTVAVPDVQSALPDFSNLFQWHRSWGVDRLGDWLGESSAGMGVPADFVPDPSLTLSLGTFGAGSVYIVGLPGLRNSESGGSSERVPLPLPGTAFLFAAGLLVLGAIGRRGRGSY